MQDRRKFVRGLIGFASTVPVISPAGAASGLAGGARPANPRAGGDLGRRIFAHWHIFRRSFENAPSSIDRYAEYLSPDGLGGKYRDSGGVIRERPLPRAPRTESNWMVLDFIDEIQTAARAGIDGFQYNIGWLKRDSKQFWIPLLEMLEASEKAGEEFSIMLSLDCAIIKPSWPIEDVVDALVSVATRPTIARASDGRLLLGAFAAELWPVSRWSDLLAGLSARGQNTYFIPTFLNPREAAPYLSVAHGASIWGGNRFSQLPAVQTFGDAVRALGKTWVAPVWSQDFRPKDRWFAEARNSELFRENWRRATESDADGIAIVTWNDYSESSEVQPSTSTQYAFYDLTKFCAAWYKLRKMPPIVEDVLLYFHRIEATDAPETGSLQHARFVNRFNDGTFNEIELLAFLVEPGRIEITTINGRAAMDAPPGLTSLRAPLAAGRPSFRLLRDNRVVIDLESTFEIRESSKYQDLLYHGGSSSRAPSRG